MLPMLATVADPFESPLTRYFSFILLGLVVTVGYVVWRVFFARKGRKDDRTLEEILREAETEARQRAASKRGEDNEALELTPAQERQRAELQRLARIAESPPTLEQPSTPEPTNPRQEANRDQ